MQKRITKKDQFFNNINLTVDDDVYVGIDVHKKSCHVAIWLNDAIAVTFVTPSDNLAIAQMLQKLTPGLKQIGLLTQIRLRSPVHQLVRALVIPLFQHSLKCPGNNQVIGNFFIAADAVKHNLRHEFLSFGTQRIKNLNDPVISE